MREMWSIGFMSVFAAVILSSTGVNTPTMMAYIVGQGLVFVGAIVAHELAHLYIARIAGVHAQVEWVPRPAVTCGAMSPLLKRTVAVGGPVCGAAFGMFGVIALIGWLQVSVLLYVMGPALVINHLSMLLPMFADGQALLN